MTDNRKKPLWPSIAALLIGVPVLYVASFGPACWLCEKRAVDQRTAWIAYRPCTWLCAHGPEPVRTSLRGYARVFGDQERLGFKAVTGEIGPVCGSSIELVRREDSVSPIDYEVTSR